MNPKHNTGTVGDIPVGTTECSLTQNTISVTTEVLKRFAISRTHMSYSEKSIVNFPD